MWCRPWSRNGAKLAWDCMKLHAHCMKLHEVNNVQTGFGTFYFGWPWVMITSSTGTSIFQHFPAFSMFNEAIGRSHGHMATFGAPAPQASLARRAKLRTMAPLEGLSQFLSLVVEINVYWYLLIFIDIYWYLLIFIDIYWYWLILIDIDWYLFIFIDIYWYLLIFIDIYWYLWYHHVVIICLYMFIIFPKEQYQ